jgi:hypothetical protein
MCKKIKYGADCLRHSICLFLHGPLHISFIGDFLCVVRTSGGATLLSFDYTIFQNIGRNYVKKNVVINIFDYIILKWLHNVNVLSPPLVRTLVHVHRESF